MHPLHAGPVALLHPRFAHRAHEHEGHAVPRSSRGLGPVDVVVPLVPDDGAGAWALHVGWQITGREFWREPAALTRARVAGPTSGIFVWP